MYVQFWLFTQYTCIPSPCVLPHGGCFSNTIGWLCYCPQTSSTGLSILSVVSPLSMILLAWTLESVCLSPSIAVSACKVTKPLGRSPTPHTRLWRLFNSHSGALKYCIRGWWSVCMGCLNLTLVVWNWSLHHQLLVRDEANKGRCWFLGALSHWGVRDWPSGITDFLLGSLACIHCEQRLAVITKKSGGRQLSLHQPLKCVHCMCVCERQRERVRACRRMAGQLERLCNSLRRVLLYEHVVLACLLNRISLGIDEVCLIRMDVTFLILPGTKFAGQLAEHTRISQRESPLARPAPYTLKNKQ